MDQGGTLLVRAIQQVQDLVTAVTMFVLIILVSVLINTAT